MNDNFCMGNLVNLNIISSGFNLGRPSLSIFQSRPFVSFPFCLQYFAGTYYCMSLSFPPLLTASVFDSLFNFSSVFDSCSPTASVKNYFIPNLPSPHLASTTQSQWIRCQTHLPPPSNPNWHNLLQFGFHALILPLLLKPPFNLKWRLPRLFAFLIFVEGYLRSQFLKWVYGADAIGEQAIGSSSKEGKPGA